MRHLLPVVLAAAAIAVGVSPAMAKQWPHHPASRVGSHISLHLSRHTITDGRGLLLKGRERPGGRHRVKLVIRGAGGGVLGTTTGRDGRFALRWNPSRTGSSKIRAYGVHDRQTRGSGSLVRRVSAYRSAAASYYGPGLYGGGMACGGTLEPATLGVANKTLPCGTKVKLLYRGRSITVPVVDRGPYVAGRDFDLTSATRERLRFPGVGVLYTTR